MGVRIINNQDINCPIWKERIHFETTVTNEVLTMVKTPFEKLFTEIKRLRILIF